MTTTATLADQHRAARMPQPRGRPWPQLRLWALGALMGLAVGSALMAAAAYRVMPIKATAVERVFADVNGDGSQDFIVSGWIVFGPKAPGQ